MLSACVTHRIRTKVFTGTPPSIPVLFFGTGGFGVEVPSTYAERQINMPKVWQPILDAHIVQSYREAMTRISSHSSAAIRSRDDAVKFAASEWFRDERTVERKLRKFSVTQSSDTI